MTEEKPLRRSKLDMTLDVLELLMTPQLKTHTFFKCNLSYTNLMEILQELEEKQLVRRFNKNYSRFKKDCESKKTWYQTTDKGLEAVFCYKTIKDILR